MLHRPSLSTRRAQRGVTLFGLLTWAIIIGFVAYVGVRVLPAINEFLTIQRAVNRVAQEAPPTVAEVRRVFCAPDGTVIYLGELIYRADFIRVEMDLLG